ncbi:MAG: pyridoxamine 5'-phosphate oxidase family protein [Anaerolineae bacterium]|nr:pyridoxamine 5'-phosphate oxidase family protein [Anaerolineae bacterium]
MTLATVGHDGVWATAVFYANINFNLFFLSAGHTRHAQNFRHQEKIAATIQEDYRDWPTIKGIQLEGIVEQLNGARQISAIAHYTQKFPFLANASTQIAAALTKVNWYQLTPTRLYFIDNSKGLGHRVQIAL